MRDALRSDLTAAIKARDTAAVSALRTTIAAIENAEAIKVTGAGTLQGGSEHVAGASAGVGSTDVPRRELSEQEVEEIVRDQIAERMEAAAGYRGLGQVSEAERLIREADLLGRYLPGTQPARR